MFRTTLSTTRLHLPLGEIITGERSVVFNPAALLDCQERWQRWPKITVPVIQHSDYVRAIVGLFHTRALSTMCRNEGPARYTRFTRARSPRTEEREREREREAATVCSCCAWKQCLTELSTMFTELRRRAGMPHILFARLVVRAGSPDNDLMKNDILITNMAIQDGNILATNMAAYCLPTWRNPTWWARNRIEIAGSLGIRHGSRCPWCLTQFPDPFCTAVVRHEWCVVANVAIRFGVPHNTPSCIVTDVKYVHPVTISIVPVNGVIEVSREQRWNKRARETGDPRENPPTNGIVRHDSHMRKSGVTQPGIEPGSPWWEASTVTAQPPWSQQFSPTTLLNCVSCEEHRLGYSTRRQSPFDARRCGTVGQGLASALRTAGRLDDDESPHPPFANSLSLSLSLSLFLSSSPSIRPLFSAPGWRCLETRLARSPTTKANRVQTQAGSPDFRKWESCRAMPLIGGSFGDLPLPPPLHSGAAPYSLQSPHFGSQDLAKRLRAYLTLPLCCMSGMVSMLCEVLREEEEEQIVVLG
ncbi:hypothetical protein PR048_019387 [Dryococelus australis]|uniref:Uncharacterized protein n=1 Tax=Dryococelus australis TaxID=614101 RepID=A0ABQ9H3C4_9NEOP|nr:hypothetical protein PR048_019387 [Dryococelus australis]